MSRIFEHLSENDLRRLLREYSEAFKTPVFVMDREKKIALSHPPGARAERLSVEAVYVRDSLLGHVAVPVKLASSSGEPSGHLSFMARNLSMTAEKAFEIESLSAEVARSYEELSLIWKLSSKLGAGLNVDRICGVLSDEVMSICPSANVTVMLAAEIPASLETVRSEESGGHGRPLDQCPGDHRPDKKGKVFFFPKVSLGRDASRASMMVLGADRGLLGDVYKRKEALTVCDVDKPEGFTYPIRRILLVPLVIEDSVIGAIVASDKLNGEEYYSTEIKLISSIATECSISIKKALLFDEIKEMLFSTAEAFALAVEAKDPYTYGHSKRVSELSASIASRFDLDPDTVNWIRLAALLHDIGKIGTPEVILDKTSRLDPEETVRMKEHPSIGARMIESIRRMKEISRWICLHHEKWDGTGYPFGLRAEEIPLPSRIIAVADFFDALTSDRPYRKALTAKEALKIMREQVGSHFDPAVFEGFEKLHPC